jgi:hypothetical protein
MVFRSGDEYADYSVGPGDIFGDEVFTTQISKKTYKTMFEVYYCIVSKEAFMKLDIFSPFRGMIGSERMPANISVVEGATPNTRQSCDDDMSNIFFSFLGGSSSEPADNRSVYSFNPDKSDLSEDQGVAPAAARHGHRGVGVTKTKTKNCDDSWCFMDWGMFGLR